MIGRHIFIWLVMSIALMQTSFAQVDFKNQYNQFSLRCQRELNNGDYILLYSSFIQRTDNVGTPIWTLEFTEGGVPLNANIALRCIQQTTDLGFIITGTYVNAGNEDVVLIKTDGAGNVTWSKQFGGGGNDHGLWVEQTPDGGYIISGTKDEFTPFRVIEGDIYVIKTDALGNLQWDNVWSAGGLESAQNIKPTSDGGYILTGNSAPEDVGLNRIYLMKLDNAGNVSWQTKYNISCASGDASSGREVWEIPGGYIVGGYVGGDLAPLPSKALFLKVDGAGNINDIGAYEFMLGGGGMTDLGFASMDVTSTGEFVGCGGGYNDFGPLYILKADANLNMVWSRTYWSMSFNSATSVRESSDNGFAFIDGTSQLLKTTDQGMIHCEVPNAVFESVANGAGINLGAVLMPDGASNNIGIQTGAANITVNVMCPPVVLDLDITSTDVNCFGGNDGEATVTVNGGTAPYSYDWQPGGQVTPTATNLVAGTYTVTVTDDVGTTATATVTIDEPAAALSVTIDPVNPICEGDNVNLISNVAGGTAPYNYLWSTGGITSTINVAPGVTTNYVVTVTDDNGCMANANIDVMVNTAPIVSFITDITQGCEQVCINFTNTTPNTQTLEWDFGDGSALDNNSPVQHCFQTAGNFDITLTITDGLGCTGSTTANNLIQVYSNPVADFNFSPHNASIADPTIQFTDLSIGATTWNWSFGDLSGTTSNLQHPEFTYSDTGTYEVELIVSNAAGCTDTVVYPVTIFGEYIIYIPNTFTPNGDEMNPVFKPYARGVVEYSFDIFNRWGELIFHSNDLSLGWSGKPKNSNLISPQGVYVYKINLTDVLGEEHQYIGQVNLLR